MKRSASLITGILLGLLSFILAMPAFAEAAEESSDDQDTTGESAETYEEIAIEEVITAARPI